ncbi:MAG: MFS transporter [Lachnospiraceae bacterium]|nr:MFS transporter [Lachnospiraceae bacterium]
MKIKLRNKLAYACGDIYGGGAFMIFSLLFMNYLVLVEGLPIIATTIIIFAGRLWDAITDPIVGRISDKTRSRFGRRRIFFLMGIIPVFLSFVMLFYSFGMDDISAKIVYYIFAYMFFGTAFAIVMVPYNAILSDMTSDYNVRTSFTTYRMMFSGLASLLAAIIPSILIRAVGSPYIGPGQRPGYLLQGIIFGCIFALCWFFVFLGTKERKDVSPAEKISLKEWLDVFDNKAYRNFLGIFLSFQIAVDLVLAMFIFYIDIVVLQYQNYELVVGTLLVCMVLFMPIHGMIAEKKGKAFPLYIGLPIWIASTFAFVFIDSGTPILVLCIISGLIAIGSAAGNLSTWSMLTDIYDVDELRTAKRREGLYSGVTTFIRKFASGFAVLLMGFGFSTMGFDQNEYSILKAGLVDFDPVVFAQNDIVAGIRTMFVVIPAVLLSICLIFALKNKLNKRRFDAILRGIACLKAKGDIETLETEEIEDILLITGSKKERLWGRKI